MLTRAVHALLILAVFAVSPRALHGQRTTVLINPFENQTGDRNLDWLGVGMASALGEKLAAQRELYMFGLDERLAEYDRLGIPDTVSVSRATSVRIAWDMGADVLVTGSISGTPGAFRVDARVLNLATDSMGSDVSIAGRLDEVISLTALLASRLARQLVPGAALPESDYVAQPPVPRSAFEAYIRGVMATDPERSVELLRDAIRLHPQYRSAVFQLGQAHYVDSDFEASTNLLTRIPPDAPEYPQARFMLGMNAYRLGDYAKATQIFATLPATYDVLVNLGASRAASGDGGAVDAWHRALTQNPAGAEAAFNLAYASYTAGELELAANRLAQFLQAHPRDSETVFLLGRTYEKLGRTAESQRLTAQALKLSPRLQRWLEQPMPNLARVRSQFDATELRTSATGGLWNEARRKRKAAAEAAEKALTGPRK